MGEIIKKDMKKDKTIPPYMDYEIKQEMPICWVQENENEYKIIIAEDFELKENNGKWFAVRKKPQYPKTIQECYDILGINIKENGCYGYKWTLLGNFQDLIICRDSYWKIADNWKPTKDDDGKTYSLFYSRSEDKIAHCEGLYESNAVLDFPTREMRDVFSENFKELINETKELL